MTATTLTASNLDTLLPHGLPSDMHAEVAEALSSGRESAIEYFRLAGYNSEATHYVFFPRARRGGVCAGGQTDWTDCSDLSDLADRWDNYNVRWVS